MAVCKNEVRVYSSSKGYSEPLATIASSAFNPEGFEWSDDGVLCGCLNPEGGVTVYNATLDYAPVYEAKKQGSAIRGFAFSPCGSFIVTHERYQIKDPKDNVHVHSISSGNVVLSLIIKTVSERNWPAFVWTRDERFVMHMVSNEIQVMHGRTPSFQNILFKIRIPDVAQFSLSPNDRFVAVFVPELKGAPASVKIFDLGDRGTTTVAQKAFYKAQSISFDWSQSGQGLLFVATTDDKSESYYGSSALYFIRLDESGKSIADGLISETVHDKQWSPITDEFVALTGALPAELALFDGRTGAKKVSFGKARKNTLRWNPFGRFFLSGGFGNLPGDADIWDKNKALCLSTTRIPCAVTSAWGPDGRTLLTATTTPRMRVDNGFQLTNYDGSIVAKIPIAELYSVVWRPEPAGRFEDSPASPRVVQLAKKPEEESPPVQAYRPRIGGAFAEQMRKEKEEENKRQAKKVAPSSGLVVHGVGVVGVDSVVKITKSRNERKKQSKAKQTFEDEAGEWTQAKKNTVRPVAVASPVLIRDESESDGEVDPAKKLRNLKKKLKEIEKLVGKEDLNESQRAKVASKEVILKEVAWLEKELEKL